ncbi:MAG: hypothetical protein IPI90_06805 [Saprospiraceae bacterium]|nr:hypothetical protein [Candidatus Vicinibacter affinis]
MGCCYTPISRLNGGINLRFDLGGDPDTFFLSREIDFIETSISVSDPISGNLLFYSNGCHIYNKNDQIMELGKDINPGLTQKMACEEYAYEPFTRWSHICQIRKQNKFYLIHRALDDTGKQLIDFIIRSRFILQSRSWESHKEKCSSA